MSKSPYLFLLLIFFAASCNNNSKQETSSSATDTTASNPAASQQQQPQPQETRTAVTYHYVTPRDSIRRVLKSLDSNSVNILSAVNRADRSALLRMDTIIMPENLSLPAEQYFPFPLNLAFLKDVKKIIFFSYPAQAFAAYENGRLVHSGPTSMGRKNDQTPTGLFYTNWKAEQTTSTFNDEWDLKWNFNIENKLGVGFHQYAMPGYPASHSCLRLKEADAKYLYDWADQWELKGEENVIAHGTPVVVFGSYPFGSSRPWLALASNPDALNISEGDLQNLVTSNMNDIMQKQAERSKLKPQ